MELMKAAVLHKPGDLRYEEIPIPVPGENEVLVRVRAASVCGSDLDRVMHTGTYSFPLIPGHEFCGEVALIGSGVTRFKPGDRVVVAPLIPCRKCTFCEQGFYGLCDSYNFLGSRANGGFAEYVVVPEANLLRLPDNIDFTEGALIEPSAVVLHGILRLDITPGDSVCILGAGALGLLSLEWVRALGARTVIISDVIPSKLELASKLGADYTIDARTSDAIEVVHKITGGQGADIVIEAVGLPVTQEGAVRAACKRGKVLFLGTAHKDVVIPSKSFEHIIRGELTMLGSWNAYSPPFPGREWTATIDFLNRGKLDFKCLISHIEPLARAPKIFIALERRLVVNKVIFLP